ncbi:hypothetical protein QLH52_04125 [Methylomonas sp. OY6]|uniref:Uncharacterized protein n=1 Tax=Methylomonas defluvii TaxID=3045149 RepID=A0ABU4UAL3_9GAMM|nr:hypothetical protein [Methylomonas sp. OY6]MDX8126455.1 hypothetical protein [Methylomonas sp. OY6]
MQLNKQWQAEQGVVQELFCSPESEAVFSVSPEYNKENAMPVFWPRRDCQFVQSLEMIPVGYITSI